MATVGKEGRHRHGRFDVGIVARPVEVSSPSMTRAVSLVPFPADASSAVVDEAFAVLEDGDRGF